jgi:hypothetical protein
VVCWLWDILDKDFNDEERRLFLKVNRLLYSRASISTDSISVVHCDPKKNWKIKEINGS